MTLGNKGMVLCTGGSVVRIPAVGTEEIVDLTGAGDGGGHTGDRAGRGRGYRDGLPAGQSRRGDRGDERGCGHSVGG